MLTHCMVGGPGEVGGFAQTMMSEHRSDTNSVTTSIDYRVQVFRLNVSFRHRHFTPKTTA